MWMILLTLAVIPVLTILQALRFKRALKLLDEAKREYQQQLSGVIVAIRDASEIDRQIKVTSDCKRVSTAIPKRK